MIKYRNTFFLFSLSAAALVACSDERMLEYPDTEPQQINIVSNVDETAKTRVVFATSSESDIQNSGNFEFDARVAVFVEGGVNMNYNAPEIYSRDVTMNEGNTAYLYPQKFNAATTQYFPTNGGNISIYAFYPSKSDFLATANSHARSLGNTETYGFSVSTTQSTAADYRASDLMFASSTNVARTSNAVPLTFYHILSKIKIVVKKGNGFQYAHLYNATVKIKNAYNTANVNLAVTDVSGDVANRANALIQDGTSGNYYTGSAKEDITLGTLPGDMSADATVCGIIVPQKIAADTEFITITLTETYNSQVFKFKPESELTFAPGTENTITLTVNSDGISVGEVTINSWGNGNTVNDGTASF